MKTDTCVNTRKSLVPHHIPTCIILQYYYHYQMTSTQMCAISSFQASLSFLRKIYIPINLKIFYPVLMDVFDIFFPSLSFSLLKILLAIVGNRFLFVSSHASCHDWEEYHILLVVNRDRPKLLVPIDYTVFMDAPGARYCRAGGALNHCCMMGFVAECNCWRSRLYGDFSLIFWVQILQFFL